MKLWIDDVIPAPEGGDWFWAYSARETKNLIDEIEWDEYGDREVIELIDINHDARDYIEILDWLEETGRNYPIRIHSANPVGVQNMRRIIERNGWKEIKYD